MLRKFLFITIALLGSLLAKSQQDPLYTQYLNNLLSINPAYAGSRDALNMILMKRQQWVGINGAPQTLTFSINSPVKFSNVGIGLNLIHDKLGPIIQTGLYADYAYHIKLSERTKLSMGIKGGLNTFSVDSKVLQPASYDSHIVYYGSRKLFLPNFGFGAYLYSDKYYFGLSIPKLLKNSLSDASLLEYNNKEERHYFLIGGFLFSISDNIRFKPSFITRVVEGAPVSAEVSTALIFNDVLWFGTMYRFGDSVGGFVQFQLSPQLKLGYAYDLTRSKLRNETRGTHEIMVSYDFNLIKSQIVSPRFF